MAKKQITKRQEKALQTKTRIYNAAIELMERKGFENITIADISKKAGVSVGAFYHYFESKNDILVEIFDQADDYFSALMTSGLQAENIPEQIVEYFGHYARFNADSGVETTQQLFNPTIKFFIKEDRPMHTLLQDLVREGQEQNQLQADDSPEEFARLLFVLARGVVFEWSLYDGSYDLEATMRQYIMRLVSTMRCDSPNSK